MLPLQRCPVKLRKKRDKFILLSAENRQFRFRRLVGRDNELHHYLYLSPADKSVQFDYKTPTGCTACVWDLSVNYHEREAWLRSVMNNHPHPDVGCTFRMFLMGDV